VFFPDETKLPRGPEPVAPEIDFAASRRAAEAAPFDACFARWDRQAAVRWPERRCGVDISAEGAFCAMHLFIPEDREVLCPEPVSHVPNVHNRPEWRAFGPVHVLQHGQTLRGRMTIRPVLLP
jgi:aldose 1-epimerase